MPHILLFLLAAIAAAGTAHARDDSWYLPTGDGAAELYVQEFGRADGPLVVALHGGWGAEHSYMIDMLRPVIGTSYHVVLYDQRGSLRSPAPPASINLETQIADLESLRIALGSERMTLLGHSMGSFLAMAYAQRHPDRVERLILVGAIPARTPPGGAAAFWQAAGAYAKRMGERPEVQRELAAIGADRRDLTAREKTHLWRIRFAASNLYRIERWRQMPGGRAFYRQSAADAIEPTMPDRWNFEPLLGTRIPTTVIGGDHDYADPGLAYWRALAARVPAVRVLPIADAAHSPWIDDPAGFARALLESLRQPIAAAGIETP